MKSVNEMIEFLRGRRSSNKRSRPSMTRRERVSESPEAVETRVLLAANVFEKGDVQADPGLSDTDLVQSYFVAFNKSQDEISLQGTTGATFVSASEFVPNAYLFHFENGMTLPDANETFSALPGFSSLYANIDRQHSTRAVPNDPLYTDQWHLSNTGQGGGVAGADANVESVWDNFTGQGVTIGIIDDGLETTHEDLVANINTAIDFDWNGNDSDPTPGLGDNHGTAVAGVASASGNNSLGVSGAAWDAELVGLRLIAGPVSDTDEASALTHELQAIDIYNNSWGPADNGQISQIGPQARAALQQSATAGRGGLGNIHTWAGGNGGNLTDDNVNYDPYANSRHTIAVGALTNSGVRATYSDPGASLIVTAYSNGGSLGITTTDLTGTAGYATGNYENDFGGTSSATPLVSGVIALMLEANPNLSYRDVTDILVHTSERVDPNNSDWVQNDAGLWVNHEYGFGGIDAAAAVAAAQSHISLGQELRFSTAVQPVNQPIPEFGGGNVSASVTVAAADAVPSLEYVEVVFNATHTFRGDLEVVLTSPTGTRSVLAESRLTDPGVNYSNWIFTTARHWDESSEGDWTITVTDRQTLDTGIFDSFELVFYGTDSAIAPLIIQTNGNTQVTDSGQSDTFDVTLPVQPSTDVILDVTSTDTGEVTVSTSVLTFTPTNWDVPQTVTVTGVTDLIGDGDQTTDVIVAVNKALSDASYAGAADATVIVTSVDDDEFLPTKPVVTAPVGITNNDVPTFTWTSGANTATFTLTVTNRLTNAVTRQAFDLTTNSHVFVGQLPIGVYETTVQAFNSVGQGSAVSDPVIFSVGVPAIPGAPIITSPTQGETVTTATPTFVWTPVTGALSYDVYARSGTQVFRQTIPANTGGTGNPSHTFTQPFIEGPATVWVRAINAFDQPGAWSEQVNFVVDAVAQPVTPTIISPVTGVTSNAFPQFRWLAPGGSTYELWVGRVPEDSTGGSASTVNNRVIRLSGHTTTSYTHFLPLANANYVVWVRSFNSAGEVSPWSPGVSFEVNVPVPDRPAVVTFIENTGTDPTIEWATTGDAYTPGTTFHLWVNNLSTGESRIVQERTLKTRTYTFADGLAQGRYGVWVQATSAVGGISAWSRRFDFEIDIPTPGRPVLTGPVPLVGDVAVKTDFPVFSWEKVINGETYDLWVNSVSAGISQIIRVTDIPAGNSYIHTAGLPEGTYRAWLRSFNVAGEVGEWSQAINFSLDVPGPAQPIVTGPVPTSGGAVETSTPTIAWTTLGGASTFNLQVEVERTNELIVNETGLKELTFDITTPLIEQSHRARVQGVNSVGEVGPWSDWYTFKIDVPNATTPIAFLPEGTVRQSQVTFQWQHTEGSVRYEILVRDLLRQESIVFQVETLQIDQSVGRAFHTATLNDGTYRYWVRAFNTQNTESGWSNGKAFTVDTVAELEIETRSDVQIALTSLTVEDKNELDRGVASRQNKLATDVKNAGPSEDQAESHVEAVMAEFADPSSELFSEEANS